MNKNLKKSCATALATVMLASSVITASASTLETSSLADAPGIPVTRLEGANRYETSVAISKANHKDPEKVKNVVIASGEDFADALSGAGLALQLDAPILLTAKGGLSKEVKEEIERLRPEKVYILGGTSAVSETVESEITTIELKEKDSKKIKRIEVKRLGGVDRFATNKEINDKIFELAGVAKDTKGTKADVYVNAYNYADAVSASNILRKSGKSSRIVLQKGTEIGKLENEEAYIVGGEKAVEITKMPTEVKRIGGADRYETSAMVAKGFNAKNGKYVFATGEDFPDALTAADVVFSQEATLLLTNRDMLNNFAKNLVATKAAKMTSATIIGGTAAISEKTEKAIVNPTLDVKSFAFVMPERTPVKNLKKLTDEEVASVKRAIETANKELPAGTKIEVEKEDKKTEEIIDGKVTTEEVFAGTTKVIFPDGSMKELKPEKTIGSFDELGMAAKFNAEKEKLEKNRKLPQVEKTPVVDKNKLQDKEANAIAEKVKEAYKDLLKDAKSVEVQKTNHTITVNDEVVLDSVAGRVVVTFNDGTISKFTGEFTREYKIADLVTVKAPKDLTPIENIQDIATLEKFNKMSNIDDIKESIQDELFEANKDLKHDDKEFKLGNGGFVQTVAFEAKDATKKDNTPVLVVYFTDGSKVSFDVKDCVEVRTAGKTSDTYELIKPVVTAEKDPRVEVTDVKKLNKTEISAIIALVNELSPLPKYSKVEQLAGYLRVTYLDYSFTDILISDFAKEAN